MRQCSSHGLEARPHSGDCGGIRLDAYGGLLAVVLVSREVRDEDNEPTSHRFTTKVAWLTVGSGLAFGLNFVLIDQAPVEARLWPLVFARISADTTPDGRWVARIR